MGTTLVSEATTTVSNVEYGYQTIELANAVELTTDEIFTVVVTFDSPETYTYIATEGPTETGVDQTVLNYKGNPGESFVCINGFWYDTSSLSGKDYNNVCVKAMTVSAVKNAGDVNDDGIVNLKDAIVLRRYLADGYSVSINERNCDVNADTEISLTDVVLIVRYLAGGYSVTLK